MWIMDSKKSRDMEHFWQTVEAVIFMLPETYMRKIRETIRERGYSEYLTASEIIKIVRARSLQPWDRLRLQVISALATQLEAALLRDLQTRRLVIKELYPFVSEEACEAAAASMSLEHGIVQFHEPELPEPIPNRVPEKP